VKELPNQEHTARQIKAIRKLNGLSQIEFAERLGVTKPIIAAIESNRIICSDEFFGRVCEVFKVSRRWFKSK